MSGGWTEEWDPDDPWPFTPRARRVIPLALYMLADELRRDLRRVEIGESTILELGRRGMVVSLMPDFILSCPPSWWEQLAASARRMADEFTQDDVLKPRTIGEHTMLFLALEDNVLGPARLECEKQESYRDLPEDDLDPYDSIFEALEISDIEFLWDEDFPHAEDPERRSQALDYLGVPDMRAHLWHEPYE